MMTRLLAPFLVLTLFSATLVAQGPIDPRVASRLVRVPPISARVTITPVDDQPGAFSTVAGGGMSRIYGIVINELGVVVPDSGQVVVRSLATGRVVAQGQVDSLGQFSIPGLDPGMYSAQLMNSAGGVVTSSPAFTVGIGEVVQLTPVVSSSSIGGLAQVLGNATGGATSSATAATLQAAANSVPIVAPLVPVSPQG